MELVVNNAPNKFIGLGMQSANGKGTQGANTLTVKEYGDGVNHVTEITLKDFVIGALAGALAALNLTPATALYTLPAGVQLIDAVRASVGVAAVGTAVSPEVGLGTTAGDGGAEATLGAAGAATENILEGYAVADTDTNAEVVGSTVTPQIIETAGGKAIYLNAAGAWNANNTGNLTASGKIVIVWKTIE